jgi:hypothetical protein
MCGTASTNTAPDGVSKYQEAVYPDGLADAIRKEVEHEVAYRPVETDGAAVAARTLAGLL